MVYFDIEINFDEKVEGNLANSTLNVRGESFYSAYDKLRTTMNPFAKIKNVYVWYIGDSQGHLVVLKYDVYNETQFKKLVSKEFYKV